MASSEYNVLNDDFQFFRAPRIGALANRQQGGNERGRGSGGGGEKGRKNPCHEMKAQR